METLQLLGTALGLTAMAGINLYLTVFVTGLAIHMGWLQLAPHLQGLEVLSDPAVLIVAGVLLVVETIVDKCAFADSAWDTIHTIIRPIGGAFIALSALGNVDPVASVIGALLGGSVALTTHSAKAGSRLMINLSPEPVTNVAASVGEDVVVLGGLYLAFQHPIIALLLVAAFLVAFWYFAPRFFRMVRANLAGLIHRFTARKAAATATVPLPYGLPGYAREALLTLTQAGETVAWAVPCFSGRLKPIGRNVHGCLVATSRGRALFIGRRNFRTRVVEFPGAGARATDEAGAVFHRLAVATSTGELMRVRFTRKHAPHVPQLLVWWQSPTTRTAVTGEAQERPALEESFVL